MIKPRDYKREYALFHGRPEEIKKRASRNKARRTLVRAGLVRKGDGRDVHHRNGNPLQNDRSNLAVVPRSYNRSIK